MKNHSPLFRWTMAGLVAAIGVTWHFSALSLIERFVTTWPRVSDILIDHWPRIDFGIYGEFWFFGLVALFCFFHFRDRWRASPDVILALGLMYFIRGWFLFLFPIGGPLGSVGADQRFSVWGHEAHAFFPGGHIAILTTLAMFAPRPWIRNILWIGLILFGFGTMLAKTHYTMDSVGGIILGWAISTWVQQRWSEKPVNGVKSLVDSDHIR